MAKLPILMYHAVSTLKSEGLTISVDKLEKHLNYLWENDFVTYHFSELANLQKLHSPKNIVITFDDGYVNQLEYALPLLEKYKLKATFFVPLNFLGKADEWNAPNDANPIMTKQQLKSLDPKIIELGFHSYYHRKYDGISKTEIADDIMKCVAFAKDNGLQFFPALAYPYGKFPRKNPAKSEFFKIIQEKQIIYGLRIGNRLNNFPFRKPYEIQRLDIKGEDSLTSFRRKIKFGKLL